MLDFDTTSLKEKCLKNKFIVLDQRIPVPILKFIKPEIEDSLTAIISVANKLEVNDTDWFWLTPKAQLRPSVVNSAKFITGKFASELLKRNWTTEKTLNNQTIDGYKEYEIELPKFSLSESKYLTVLSKLREINITNYGDLATTIFQRYVNNSQPFLLEELKSLISYFDIRQVVQKYRVGLEFETGNIASSFRAIQKLDSLHDLNLIDAGVFITSIDKTNCSTRIWPASNRNGSFEELNNRNYRANRSYPAIDIGFQPDCFSSKAPYLSEHGETYLMKEGKTVKIDGFSYVEATTHDGVKKYRRV